MAFPFKALALYRVKKSFTSLRSNSVFTKDALVQYQSSSLNHYESIEICEFKEKDSGEKLTWHADEIALENWASFLEAIP